MFASKNLRHALGSLAASLLILACLEEESTQGGEGKACYGNGTCDAGLVCNADKRCVGPGGASGSGGSGGGSVSVIDLDACFACGESACPNEASACQDSAGCSELLSCNLGCAGNANCVGSCDASGTTQADVTNMAAFTACAVGSCTSECSANVDVGSGSGSGSNGGSSGGGSSGGGSSGGVATGVACTTEGDRTGSCAAGNLEVCTGGQWVTDACLICGVVTPESQCVDVRLVTLEERGTLEMSDLVGVANPEMEVVATGDTLSAEWYLEVNQMGVLQFEFASGIDPARIDIQGPGSAVEFVTLETPGGASGCQYTLSGGRLVRYRKMTGTNVDWYGCWGDFETLTTSEPTTTTVMNVRTPVSPTNALRTMNVSSILL